jgi:hypothetical protein
LLLLRPIDEDAWKQLRNALPSSVLYIIDTLYVDNPDWSTVVPLLRKNRIDRVYTSIGSELFNDCLGDVHGSSTCHIVAVG